MKRIGIALLLLASPALGQSTGFTNGVDGMLLNCLASENDCVGAWSPEPIFIDELPNSGFFPADTSELSVVVKGRTLYTFEFHDNEELERAVTALRLLLLDLRIKNLEATSSCVN